MVSENKNDFTFDEKIKGNNRKSKLKGGKNASKKAAKRKAQPPQPGDG